VSWNTEKNIMELSKTDSRLKIPTNLFLELKCDSEGNARRMQTLITILLREYSFKPKDWEFWREEVIK